MRTVYTIHGSRGTNMEFNHTGGFDNVRVFEDLNGLVVCPICEDSYIENDGYYVGGDIDDRVCEHCWDEQTVTCGRCEERYYIEETKWSDIEEEHFCNYCQNSMNECDICYDVMRVSSTVETADGAVLCETCAQDETFVCEECEETYSEDYEKGRGICEDCCDDLEIELREKETELADKENEIADLNEEIEDLKYKLGY